MNDKKEKPTRMIYLVLRCEASVYDGKQWTAKPFPHFSCFLLCLVGQRGPLPEPHQLQIDQRHKRRRGSSLAGLWQSRSKSSFQKVKWHISQFKRDGNDFHELNVWVYRRSRWDEPAPHRPAGPVSGPGWASDPVSSSAERSPRRRRRPAAAAHTHRTKN